MDRPLCHPANHAQGDHPAAFLLLVIATIALGACGGSADESERSAKQTLSTVKPLESAQVGAALRILFDNAPPSVGERLELTFTLRNNGPDKLPSLDWNIAFSGLTTQLTSRVVSTGDNVFIKLGGQDFELGQQAVARFTTPAPNRDDADGITGGRMEYKLEYTDVNKPVTIAPPDRNAADRRLRPRAAAHPRRQGLAST